MKRLLLLFIVLALAGTVAIAGMTAPKMSMADQKVERQISTVESGSVTSSIKATGQLEPNRTVDLAFQSDGKVAEIYVKEGDTVYPGDKLSILDTTDLEIAVHEAQITLNKAKAELETTTTGATSDQIASKRAALASAQAAYDVLVAGPSQDEVTSSGAALRQAEVALEKAQGDYDKISWRSGTEATEESVALQDATLTYQKALADYNVAQKPPSDDELKSAKANIASAQYDLNELLRGSTDAEIAVSQAAVDSAQIDLESAQRAVERALLTAPFTATVTAINIDVGAFPLTENSVMVLADLGTLYANVSVDEIDRPSVKVGQEAIVTLDALPSTPLTGTVTFVSPAPSSSDSDTATTYEVRVAVGAPPEGVSTGMTAKVEIQTASRDGVPVIPTTLVQTDSATGETYVDKVGPDGQAVHTTVTLGLRSGANIEVISGLQIGDQVFEPVATTSSSTSSATNAPQSGGMFGMPGGGPPPGGGPADPVVPAVAAAADQEEGNLSWLNQLSTCAT